LNFADGAIGYLENDYENEKIFKVISKALKSKGKSLIDICNRDHAIKHFPKKHWEIGKKEISMPWFDYDKDNKKIIYGVFIKNWRYCFNS
jgi:pyruvate/2-oxoacid:ferredoxin oxidoreductase beta subunit